MECQNTIQSISGKRVRTMTDKAGGPLGPVEKDQIQLLEELLEEVKGLRRHMHTVSEYVDGLTRKIEEVLDDDPLDEARHVGSMREDNVVRK
jgi:hypothetical protein